MDDDFEIEVTDLNTGAPIRHALDKRAPEEPGRDDDDWPAPEPVAPPMPSTPSTPSTARRRQTLRAAIVSGVLLLAVTLVILINPAAKSSLYTVFHFPTPVPSPTPLPGGNLVYLAHGAPWGKVTLDGKPQPDVNLGMTAARVALPPGRHTIVVTQPPFPTLRCAVSYPSSSADSCPLTSPHSDQWSPYGAGAAPPTGSRFVDLGARFSRLPRDAQDTLVAAINAQLNLPEPPLTLYPGDHYLRDDGGVAIARAPLQASFIPTLLPPENAVGSDSPSCVSFCDLSGVDFFASGSWNIMVSLLGSWRVTTVGGQVLVEHAPMFASDPLYAGFSPSMQVMMSMLWTGTWQVSARDQYNSWWFAACRIAGEMLSAQLMARNLSATGLSMLNGRTPEWGCVLNPLLDNISASDPVYVYYRFGVLLASNSATRRLLPSLPAASATEQAQMRQILRDNP